MWGENGEKQKLRKMFLTHFLKEVFSLFQEEHSDIKIGFSKFCALRPVNVLLLKKLHLINANVPNMRILCLY